MSRVAGFSVFGSYVVWTLVEMQLDVGLTQLTNSQARYIAWNHEHEQ